MGPQGTPTKSFSARWARRAMVNGSRVYPESVETASTVAHSTAAEEERPAPEGTWESRTRSTGSIGRPVVPSDQKDPSRYPGQPATGGDPGEMSANATLTTSPGFCAETTRTVDESARPAAIRARASMANGSTRPPL